MNDEEEALLRDERDAAREALLIIRALLETGVLVAKSDHTPGDVRANTLSVITKGLTGEWPR